MKLSLFFVVLNAVTWAVAQHVGVNEGHYKRGRERRVAVAQHHDPPDRPNVCDKCDRVYLDCIYHSDFGRTHSSQECKLHCSIEACDFEDCYKCGWKDCTHKIVLQDETQHERGVSARSPIAQHNDPPPRPNPCDKCDKKFESCMNDWWCWFHKEICFKDCRIQVCQDSEECHHKCGYKDCEIRRQSAEFQEHHRVVPLQHDATGSSGVAGDQQLASQHNTRSVVQK